jgi:hypothetical protein
MKKSIHNERREILYIKKKLIIEGDKVWKFTIQNNKSPLNEINKI